MKTHFIKLLVLFFCLLFFAGCASVTKGKYQEITVESNILGAIVELDGVELGYTPFRGKIKKGGRAKRIKVSKPGYSAGDIEVGTKKRDNKAFTSGNIGLGFGIGGSPFFMAGMFENFVDYPKRKKDYEERASRGETAYSEEPPHNDAIFYSAFGLFAAASSFGFFVSTDMSTSAAWEYSPSSYYVQLKEIGQSSSDYSNELSIRYFATMNHSQIAIDAGKNNGEYAEALANILEAKLSKEAARQGINEALEESKGNQVMFGDALMERFRR
jgi:hypothetical protein